MQPEPIMPFHLKQILSIMGSKIFTSDFKIFYLLFFSVRHRPSLPAFTIVTFGFSLLLDHIYIRLIKRHYFICFAIGS